MLWSYILKLAVLLPLICGLMIGCLYLWRRLESRMPGRPATRLIHVRETMMISPGLRLAVIEFEGRNLLVSVGRGGVQLVDKVEVKGQAPIAPAPVPPTPPRRGDFVSRFAPKPTSFDQ
ncbi:flagellar protein FliO/FliZ [Sphingomonas sp. SORGH_AS870]|uniref:flagellar biosynthetic protein FliO n=1 Tax=Sphingomonas sp. SORGH_AS_0870 TaxID=3041801 RepID=UPI00285F3FF5|nr:flagellar biosynthetic protein FliO [Sphingomonas sp. SORGH_AS_0870]MDR6144737.1 flagellar protein FliO/FliZ [Sphingomonas sp. SORGH_AS_0870]